MSKLQSVSSFLSALGLICALSSGHPLFAQQATNMSDPVTAQKFTRAETDRYFADFVKEAGGLGVFHHDRNVADVAHQTVIRMNRDTLYSFAVVDLDAGPVTITTPKPDGQRFMSVMVVNEDHYIVGEVLYGGGTHTFSKDDAGTRYLGFAVRTLVDPRDPADLEKVHALQDQITLVQDSKGSFEVPQWDKASLDGIRNALLELGKFSPFGLHSFGSKEQVDPIDHLIGTAVGWGGNPPEAAAYASGVAPQNDGKDIYKLHVGDVPVDGFWSISVYNGEGFFVPNDLNAYSVNNITATKSADGSVDIQFGGCDGKVPIPIMDGWNYAIRLYRPRAEILDGSWKFPEAQPAT
jgi:hypothetical protein